jgi:Cu-Zn family superoxide dismutase
MSLSALIARCWGWFQSARRGTVCVASWTVAVVLVQLVGMSGAIAAPLAIEINATAADGVGASLGSITVEDTDYGLLLTPNLGNLPPGVHGFHIHQNPDCGAAEKDGSAVPGLAAGGHFDPTGAGAHLGPYALGHLGDLPPLMVDADGTAMLPVLAPRPTVADLQGRSLTIHAGGDNYSDHPAPLGGGGARIACGVVS